VTVFAKFLGMSGFIYFKILIFYTKIWRGIRHNKFEKYLSLGTVIKLNFFSISYYSYNGS
jgi:hypothetical protein